MIQRKGRAVNPRVSAANNKGWLMREDPGIRLFSERLTFDYNGTFTLSGRVMFSSEASEVN